MTGFRLLLGTFVLVGVLVAAGCGGGGGGNSTKGSNGVPNDAIAVVAGTKVPRSQLDEELQLAKVQYKQSFPKAGTSEYQALQQQAAVYLVTQREYELDAGRRGITVTDADVGKAINALIKHAPPNGFGGDQKKFDQWLKSTGFTMTDLRYRYRQLLLRQRLFQAVAKGVTVTSAEVTQYYNTHKDQSPYSTPQQRKVRHILVAVNSKGVGVSEKGVTDTKVDFAKSKTLADKVYRQLQAGAKFDTLVKKYSQDPGSRNSGGVYVDVEGAGTAKEFEQVAFSLKTHEISKPTKTQFGYHIIQALGPLKPRKTETLEQASKSIRQTLLQQKRTDVVSTWAKELGAKYKGKVRYASGYAPPTTSSTTTTSP